jgi:hypothetical protein
VAAAAAASPAVAAGTRPTPVGLPSSSAPLTPSPPLQTTARLFGPEGVRRLPLSSDERVVVEIDRRGRPVGIRVVQRLVVLGKGDYALAVPAPAIDIVAGRGSESQPGLRRGAIVWMGFSPRRRTLVADARLRVDEAAPFLPVHVSVNATIARTTLVVENATGVRTYAYSADVDPREARATLRQIRAAVRRGSDVPSSSLTALDTPKVTTVRAFAPLRVDGELRARRGAAPKRFSAVLGDGGATRLRLVLPGRLPLLTLRARPVAPRRMLAGGDGGTGRQLFARAFAVLRTLALARQYRQFLLNPDPTGRSDTVYVFSTRVASSPPAAPPPSNDSSSPGWKALAAGLALLTAAGLVVAWAHS